MYRVRLWSVRNAGWLSRLYDALEAVLASSLGWLSRLGDDRADRLVANVERVVKGFFFDTRSCGQCTLGSTGMACPMNCPKSLRNGPCGGVRADSSCEVKPEMVCVWVTAWEGSQRMRDGVEAIQVIQAPLDERLRGNSSWLRAARLRLTNGKGRAV
jgi:hypothetical protein